MAFFGSQSGETAARSIGANALMPCWLLYHDIGKKNPHILQKIKRPDLTSYLSIQEKAQESLFNMLKMEKFWPKNTVYLHW